MLMSPSGQGPEQDTVASSSTDSLTQSCFIELHALMHKSPAVRFACLSLADGRPFAFAGTADARLAPRIAAIAASLLGLSESFAKETQNGRCAHTTISCDHGTTIVVKVAARTRAMVLSVSADRSENLAMVLRRTLDTAERVALHIDG